MDVLSSVALQTEKAAVQHTNPHTLRACHHRFRGVIDLGIHISTFPAKYPLRRMLTINAILSGASAEYN